MTARIPTRTQRQAMDWSLVLISQGIESTIEHSQESGWNLCVAEKDFTPALRALRAYRLENPEGNWHQTVSPGGLLFDWGCIGWVILIALFHWLNSQFPELRAAGLMDAHAVSQGEWWRLFTAIFLHGDLGHLAANAAIGAVLLGLTMGRYGWGVGLLAAYVSGAGGNVLTWLTDETHRSLGASGMVMACVGLLAAPSVSGLRKNPEAIRYLVSALAGGVMLFVLTGLGPGTDMLAHFGGFLSGLLLGFPLALAGAATQRAKLNIAAGSLFGALLLITWGLAIR